MILVDLHVHSTCSDGTTRPLDLAKKGAALGISVMSLADHDTTEGVADFLVSCRRCRVAGVSGVELSAEFGSVLHILGYRYDPDHPELKKEFEELRRGRDVRNREICLRLQKLGHDVSIEEVEAEAHGEVVARPHIARVMVRKGRVPDMASAFVRYLAHDAPAYVPRYRLSPERCIGIIRKAGGVAVLAHPGQTTGDPDVLRKILRELKSLGLWGLECMSSRHTPEQVFTYLRIASELALFPTAGSDYHGDNRPGVSMGIAVSEDLTPWARLGVSL
jgi:predicted metal-dependent phosphoesterase TrpH